MVPLLICFATLHMEDHLNLHVQSLRETKLLRRASKAGGVLTITHTDISDHNSLADLPLVLIVEFCRTTGKFLA